MGKETMKYRVGAFDGEVFKRWAGYPYKEKKDAEEYRDGCIRLCSAMTGLQYRVIEVDE